MLPGTLVDSGLAGWIAGAIFALLAPALLVSIGIAQWSVLQNLIDEAVQITSSHLPPGSPLAVATLSTQCDLIYRQQQTARALSARAFTVGPDIAFNAGEYQPGSELFVVYTEGRTTLLGPRTDLQNRGLVVKITRLFRL